MAVNDHGLEALRKSAEQVTDGNKSDYFLKTGFKGLAPASYHNIQLTYNANNKVDTVVFRDSNNNTIKTLQFSYTGDNLTGVSPLWN